MTLVDDRLIGANASTLGDRPEWHERALSAISLTRWLQQRAPLVVGVDLAERRLRALHLSREVTVTELEKLKHLARQTNRLLALPANWDGRGGEPLDLEVVRHAVPVIAALALLASTTVELFGQPDGGVQAEWHLGRADVEIEFDVEGDVVALVRDESGDSQADFFDAVQHRIRHVLAGTSDPAAAFGR